MMNITKKKARDVSKSAKSTLARLLATENLQVQHKKIPTAYFDTKNRVLALPIWEGMSDHLYDLLVGHEVGHALATPNLAAKDASGVELNKRIVAAVDPKNPRGVMGFVNVVEDVRIEKVIKNRFPGIRRDFIIGYQELIARDFFKTAGKDINSFGLIDRMNIHFKAGSQSMVRFSDKEQPLVDMVDACVTFDDVVEAVKVLYQHSKDEAKTDRHSGGEPSDGEGEGEENDGPKKLIVKPAKKGEKPDNKKINPADYDEIEFQEADEDKGDAADAGNDSKDDAANEDATGKGDDEGDEDGNSKGTDGEETDDDADGEGAGQGSDEDEGKESNKGPISNGPKGGVGTPGDEPMPRSETDDAWEETRKELAAKSVYNEPLYVTIPRNLDATLHIVDYKTVLSDTANWLSADAAIKAKEFRTENNRVISYMVKEFEMRKAAAKAAKIMVSNTGMLDMNKIHGYKYSEDLFRKSMNTPTGKNHGCVIVIDWSGSMDTNMAGTMEQLLNLVLFCKRVGIPFDVYAFSDVYHRTHKIDGEVEDQSQKNCKEGDIILSNFHMLNLISSRASASEYSRLFQMMIQMRSYFKERNDSYYGRKTQLPGAYNLGGTPLNSAIIATMDIVSKFQEKNKIEIMNTIFLTDGESAGGMSMLKNGTKHSTYGDSNTVLVDERSKATIQIDTADVTAVLLKMLKERTGTNLVGFFLVESGARGPKNAIERYFTNEENRTAIRAKFHEDGYVTAVKNVGYDELHLIKGGAALEIDNEDFDLGGRKTNAGIARAFAEHNNNKAASRKMLTSLIKRIA